MGEMFVGRAAAVQEGHRWYHYAYQENAWKKTQIACWGSFYQCNLRI